MSNKVDTANFSKNVSLGIKSFKELYSDVQSGNRNAWVLAPGEHGRMMERFVEAGIAAIDWWSFGFGDLGRFKSREEIMDYMKKRARSDHSFSNDSLCLYQFSHEIKLGDVIFCKRGHTELIGVGVVTTPYYHSETDELGRYSKKFECFIDTYKERIGVKWLSLESREYLSRLPLKTLTKLKGKLIDGLFNLYSDVDINHIVVPLDNTHTEEEKINHADSLNMDELKTIARMQSKRPTKEVKTTVIQKIRDPYIAEFARRRAKGICQLCGLPAPFNRSDGTPYLESHHIKWLADGGEDSIENTAALCPNCHRKMHIVNDPEDVELLIAVNRKMGLDN